MKYWLLGFSCISRGFSQLPTATRHQDSRRKKQCLLVCLVGCFSRKQNTKIVHKKLQNNNDINNRIQSYNRSLEIGFEE